MTRTDKLWSAVLCFGFAAGLVLIMWALGGCAAGLAKGYEISKVAIDEAYGHAKDECSKRALACVAEGVKAPEQCKPLEQCKRWLVGLTAGRKATGNAFAATNEVFDDLRKAGVIE